MITVGQAAFARKTDDALLVLACEGSEELYGDARLLALLSRARRLEEFGGRRDEEIVLIEPPEVGARRVILRGLGAAGRVEGETLRQAAGRAARRAQQMKRRGLSIAAPERGPLAAGEEPWRALLEGAFLGNHRVDRERREREAEPLSALRLLVRPEAVPGARRIAAEVEAACGAQLLARDWVNLPANEKPPARLAARIAREARRAGLAVERLPEPAL
ncbi:MAG: M17 family peptidase N-terminal domain-containing protein, partial [Desulfobacterales bacterium]